MTNAELGAIITKCHEQHSENRWALELAALRSGQPIERVSALSAYMTTHRGQTPKD